MKTKTISLTPRFKVTIPATLLCAALCLMAAPARAATNDLTCRHPARPVRGRGQPEPGRRHPGLPNRRQPIRQGPQARRHRHLPPRRMLPQTGQHQRRRHPVRAHPARVLRPAHAGHPQPPEPRGAGQRAGGARGSRYFGCRPPGAETPAGGGDETGGEAVGSAAEASAGWSHPPGRPPGHRARAAQIEAAVSRPRRRPAHLNHSDRKLRSCHHLGSRRGPAHPGPDQGQPGPDQRPRPTRARPCCNPPPRRGSSPW